MAVGVPEPVLLALGLGAALVDEVGGVVAAFTTVNEAAEV